MNWFLTAILCVVLVEIALRLPFTDAVARAANYGGRAVRVVRANAVSDHWKEKALAAYAQATFLSSIKLAGFLAVLLTIAAVFVVALEQISGGFQSFILGWRGIGFSIVFASLYPTVRKLIVNGRL